MTKQSFLIEADLRGFRLAASTWLELLESEVTIVNIHGVQPDLDRVLEFYGQGVVRRLRRR